MESIKKTLGNILDKFYEKFPGSYWAFLGGIFGFLVFIIAAFLHSLSKSYNIFEYAVSALGWGPNGSEPVFKIGLIVLGCLLAPYILHLTRLLWANSEDKRSKLKNLLNALGIITALISVIGLFNVSLWGNVYTQQPEFILHIIGAFVYFVFAMVFTSLFTLSMILSKNWSKIQVIFTIIMIVEFIIFIILTIGMVSNTELINIFISVPIDQRSTLFASLMKENIWWNFFEWLNVLSTLVWMILTGLHTLKLERNFK